MAHIFVDKETLPEVWEKSVLQCWGYGDAFKTQYDKSGDPESKDCTAMLVVRDPLKEPRIHRGFPGGLDDLEIYRQEVVEGVRDHWVDSSAGKWSYTYHQRLTSYDTGHNELDQLKRVVELLVEAPHTRRAQAITWSPIIDLYVSDPACLQRLWFRINEKNELIMQVSMRSNDAFKAAFMNMYAFIELQKWIAQCVSEISGEEIVVGTYTHFANSYHIYGSYFKDFKGFLKTVEDRIWEDRVWDSTSDFVQSMFDLGSQRLMEEQEKEGFEE